MSIDVVAFTQMLSVPVIPCKSNWLALEYGYQQECDAVSYTSGHSSKASVAEPCLRKYAQIETEDRDLDQRQCREVKVFIEIVDFEDCCDVVEWNSPDIFA